MKVVDQASNSGSLRTQKLIGVIFKISVAKQSDKRSFDEGEVWMADLPLRVLLELLASVKKKTSRRS